MAFFTNKHPNILPANLPQWLDWAAGHAPDKWQVALPMIQRGFVWKPAQIIELWDSLLQGLPIGALLVSEMEAGMQTVNLLPQAQPTNSTQGGCIALVDGQQRTLAMLTGWPLPVQTSHSHRLWVDFADTPRSGELLRLRITTRNQPFGYSRDNPNAKLSQEQRRAAQAAWSATEAGTKAATDVLADFQHTRPYHAKPSLALDMRDLVAWWREEQGDVLAWEGKVLQALQGIARPSAADASKAAPDPATVWETLPQTGDNTAAQVKARIAALAQGLKYLCAADVALVRVDPSLFQRPHPGATEPPLALLFKRIGSNATPLSNEDYVYAILKHLCPAVHHMVEKLHSHACASTGQPTSVASLVSPTHLVMSALRLAAAAYADKDNLTTQNNSIPDPYNPDKADKEAFHRLIGREGFLKNNFLPLLQNGSMQRWFDRVLMCLDYPLDTALADDAGLPRHAMPYLTLPLVQVLLRLAQVGYLGQPNAPMDAARRADVLRLVLHWWLCVTDRHEASRLAYQVINTKRAENTITPDWGQKIAQAIVAAQAGFALESPNALLARPGLVSMAAQTPALNKARGWSRFVALPNDDADARLCKFWQHWCAPSTYRHPLLLWLQRSYVQRSLGGDPLAGQGDDTPYDYDHLLPYNHWGQWAGAARDDTRFIDHCDHPQHGYVIGNAIGNIRVWNSSDNRSDGADAPAHKLYLVDAKTGNPRSSPEDQKTSTQLLQDSAVSPKQAALWANCLPATNQTQRHWTAARALAFEEAVYQRSFALYEQYYRQAGFALWYPNAVPPPENANGLPQTQ